MKFYGELNNKIALKYQNLKTSRLLLLSTVHTAPGLPSAGHPRPTLPIRGVRSRAVRAVLLGGLPVEPRRKPPLGVLQSLIASWGAKELHLLCHHLFRLLVSKAKIKSGTKTVYIFF